MLRDIAKNYEVALTVKNQFQSTKIPGQSGLSIKISSYIDLFAFLKTITIMLDILRSFSMCLLHCWLVSFI